MIVFHQFALCSHIAHALQDLASWAVDGVAGLQSVVLYALPELDGAVDAVPLGGLVGEEICLVPERVTRLAGRLKAWVALRRAAPAVRKLAVVLYGFPVSSAASLSCQSKQKTS